MSQVGYAYNMKVCIHRRAGSIGSTIYVCMHDVCMYYVCMYVYIDAPRVLGVLYMYVCMMYACIMYVCTQFGALFGAPISIRRADRRAGWYRCVQS